jgi:leucyl-tRNA synthetase
MKAMASISTALCRWARHRRAKAAITKKLVEIKAGKEVVNYKLRDWIFSRQRYWGEPIPMVTTKDGKELPLPEDQLPLVFCPELDDYRPTAMANRRFRKPRRAGSTSLSMAKSHPGNQHDAAMGGFVLVLHPLSRSA